MSILRAIFLSNFILNTAVIVSVHSIPLNCEPGKETCSECYNALVNEIISSDRNQFNLQNAFFPPDTSYPVFVEVTYYYTRNMSGNGTTNNSLTVPNETWFWTESTYYLFQPVLSLQYTSLLFADISIRKGKVSLYLQPECEMADSEMTKLLTQRLKLYAMQQRIHSPITNSYEAKGESLETLKDFHSGKNPALDQGKRFAMFELAFQIVFPLVVCYFLCWFLIHSVQHDSNFFESVRKWLQKGNDVIDKKGHSDHFTASRKNMHIVILNISSIMFVVYVIALDFVAIHNRNFEVSAEIFYRPNHNSEDEYSTAFVIGYTIPFLILVYDLITLFCAVLALIFLWCNHCSNCSKGHCHDCKCNCCRKKCDCQDCDNCTSRDSCHRGHCYCYNGKCQCHKECRFRSIRRMFSWYCIGLAPLFCLITHSYHILIGFIQTPEHAASILIFYAVVVSVFYLTLKAAYYNLFQFYIARQIRYSATEKNDVEKDYSKQNRFSKFFPFPHPIVLVIMCCIALFLAWFMVFVVALFILVPINMAIEDAPARLLSINQTVLVLIGAAITYNLYRGKKNKSSSNLVEQLVKANEEYLKETVHQGVNTFKKWDDLKAADKEVEMGKLIISALHSVPPLLSPVLVSAQKFAKAVTKVLSLAKYKTTKELLSEKKTLVQALVQTLAKVKAYTEALTDELETQAAQPLQNQVLASRLIPNQVQTQAQAQILRLIQGLAPVQDKIQDLHGFLGSLLSPAQEENEIPKTENPAQALAAALKAVQESICEAFVRPLTQQQNKLFQVLEQLQAPAIDLANILDPAQDRD